MHAISGAAGVILRPSGTPDYGVDGTLRAVKKLPSRRLVESGASVEFQLKSTINWEVDGTSIAYDLEAKTYNDLVTRGPFHPPLILILLCLPKERDDWIAASREHLTLKHCCYWALITGEPTDNKRSKRISIPQDNLLDPNAISRVIQIAHSHWSR